MASNAKVALLCAYTLASARHYNEAEALILSDGELAKTTEAMDLLARIRAEQGDSAEARRLWQEIQSVHPEHAPSRLALRHLGKPPCNVPWKTLLLIVAPLMLAVGLVIGTVVARRAVPARETVTWAHLPTGENLSALSPYRGRVARICLSSGFFSDPVRVNQRKVLVELLVDALEVAPEHIFVGDAPADHPPEAILLELETR